MPGLLESPVTPLSVSPAEPSYSVTNQRVVLDIDFFGRSLKGKTEITIIPHSAELRIIRLHCRQQRITRLSTSVGRIVPSTAYNDPHQQTNLPGETTVHQWHMLQNRLENQFNADLEPELVISLPKSTRLQELSLSMPLEGIGRRFSVDTISAAALSEQGPKFQPITISIDFTIQEIRDGMHFVGCEPGDLRYPHLYTQNSSRFASSCLFPCVDSINSRCSWDVSIKCAKTIGDALGSSSAGATMGDGGLRFSEEDKAMDLIVVCSGDMTDDIVDSQDTSKRITSFRLDDPTSARHLGIAVGPFEQVDLTSFRESQEDERLGKSATPVHGFCLPGRVAEVKNTCFPIAKVVDFYVITYGAYPSSSYKMVFVDDMCTDLYNTAAMNLCSNRLLFPEDVMDTLNTVTRELAFAVAAQWIGVSIVPSDPRDSWVTIGLAYYMADIFMRKLAGNNEYRYRQKRAADAVIDTDVARPSLYDTGAITHLDRSEAEFIALKAPMIMFILDRRLTKSHGTAGLVRIVSKILLNQKTGDLTNGELSTAQFMRLCEKVGHTKLETFFNHWVYGAGCPLFQVTQRFNKKRLVVEMLIKQVQHEQSDDPPLKVETFLRDVKEEMAEVYAADTQHTFTGPMTIRIHEADGTPYEHIVEIKDMITRFEIPYNTKYKRLKRSRRQKERLQAGGVVGNAGEGGDDVLLYCLGDVLQSEEEVREWRIAEFSKEEEERMNSESFEWIRLDADFEWICRARFNMPSHMYLSQLQQDRDVVAQMESIQYMAAQRESPQISSFLVRTLMDQRYFYGIRMAAASALARHAKDEVGWTGLFHLEKAFQAMFCIRGTDMVRPNNFSNRALYMIQCAIVRAMTWVRDNNGRAPFRVRKFLYEKLRFNDNTENEYSDGHYILQVIRALGDSVACSPITTSDMLMDADDPDDLPFFKSCMEEIDRYRRLDEWLPSHRNVVSVVGIEAKRELMHLGRTPRDPSEFLQYTRVGSDGAVRIAAFEALMKLGFLRNADCLQWFFFNLSSDPSPHVRMQLQSLFGQYLGGVAIGIYDLEKPMDAPRDGLIIEGEHTTASRQADEARKRTVAGALAALKADLGADAALKSTLWAAVCSPTLTISELGFLLDVCSWLYDPETRLPLILKYPRYWRAESQRSVINPDGSPGLVMNFSRSTKIRTKRMQKWQPPLPVVRTEPVKPSVTSLKRKSTAINGPTPAPPSMKLKMPKGPPSVLNVTHAAGLHQPGAGTGGEAKKPILKLKFGSQSSQAGTGNGGTTPLTPSVQTPGSLKLKFSMGKPKTPTQ